MQDTRKTSKLRAFMVYGYIDTPFHTKEEMFYFNTIGLCIEFIAKRYGNRANKKGFTVEIRENNTEHNNFVSISQF